MVATTPLGLLKRSFRRLPDPRVAGRTTHRLLDIVVIAVCAVIADCDDWPEVAQFARKREAWFRRFLELPGGIPSHDTFERVFGALDRRAFQRGWLAWLQAAGELAGLGHIAIDGKALRGSGSAALGPLYLVRAWATAANLSLGQVAVDKKSNEITAIPPLLELLDLRGALVSIDAMGCQKEIAQQVVARGGDYVLAVKGNQARLLGDIQLTVQQALDGELPAGVVARHSTVEEGHGRREERSYVVVHRVTGLRDRKAWPDAKAVGMCLSERTVGGETSSEVHYFLGSRRMGARKYAQVLRQHWRIENNLHWQLDISFGEDLSRIQQRQAAENFSQLRKMALCLLKRHPDKESIARKRKGAALDPAFLEEILAGATKLDKV